MNIREVSYIPQQINDGTLTCTGKRYFFDNYFWDERNAQFSCQKPSFEVYTLTPSEMKLTTNGFYDFLYDFVVCDRPNQEFLNIEITYNSSPFIALFPKYTTGTFIANPIIIEFTSLP